MTRRGFTLMEVMVASAMGMVVLTATLSVGLQLQRKAFLEQQTSLIQGGTQAVAEFFGPMLQRAGEGMGNARVNLGGTTFTYAIQVTSADPFNGFPNFSPPPPSYADRLSDSLQLRWGDPTAVVPLASCALSGADGGTGGFSRENAGLCTATQATALDAGTPVFVVNPDLPEACSQIVTGPSGSGTPGVHAPTLPAAPYPNSNDAPAGDGCALGGALFATQRTVVMPAGGVTFRVNWNSGEPVLEFTNRAPPLPTDTWTELSRDVEQMTVALGVRDLNADAGVPLTWFPGADGGVSIDQCVGMSPTGGCAVPGGMGPPALDPTAWDALMRRVRAVEVRLVARSVRRERPGVAAPDSGVFARDEVGNPDDGFIRRTLVLTLAPRNYQLAGSF
ncbi:MAG TPA: prepilin-type N-terminal cleavage/methylation domain-containing protein [Myxococcaceae bacterium]|nr:prepilin-type N-terminal cleavage/methylation domain-containing protein [Myxococcaceae bacterium]